MSVVISLRYRRQRALSQELIAYIRHFVVGMDQIGQALDDFRLEYEELFNNNSLGQDMRHYSNGKDADFQKAVPFDGITNTSGNPDPAKQLKLLFFWNLVLLNKMLKDLIIG